MNQSDLPPPPISGRGVQLLGAGRYLTREKNGLEKNAGYETFELGLTAATRSETTKMFLGLNPNFIV